MDGTIINAYGVLLVEDLLIAIPTFGSSVRSFQKGRHSHSDPGIVASGTVV
jgi:hypothetical protein